MGEIVNFPNPDGYHEPGCSHKTTGLCTCQHSFYAQVVEEEAADAWNEMYGHNEGPDMTQWTMSGYWQELIDEYEGNRDV